MWKNYLEGHEPPPGLGDLGDQKPPQDLGDLGGQKLPQILGDHNLPLEVFQAILT